MASYDAVIKLVVQGEDALKRIQDRVDKLYKTIDDLENKKKYAGSQAAASFVRQQADELERVLATSKQIIKQDEQRIIKQSKLNSAVDLYERRLKQTVNSGAAGLKKFEGQIKDVEAAFKFFKDRGNVTAVQALATELGRMVEYSNSVSRNERARAANQSKVFEYVKQINSYEAQGLKVAEARKKLSEFTAVASTNQLNEAKKYADAVERQLRLLREQAALQKQVAAETNVLQSALAKLEATQREVENSKLDQKALQIQSAFDRQAAAAAESAAQIDKLNQRQAEFLARTDAAAAAAKRQTAEFIRQQRIAKEVAKINANAPAPQLLLAPAAPGAPAMGGGARSLITGPVERLGGARTQDQADMALRFAQALKEQVRPLTQIEALYAGIASEAAAMQRVKALPDAAMLNAASRGIKSLETGQDRYNRELAESAERLQQLDRLEASRARRAEKLRQIADYYGTPSAMANAGFGVQGPAMPPGGVRRSGAGGGRTDGVDSRLENIALGVGFPLLFGGGAGEVLGSLAGSFVGTGFGGQILGGAIGGIIDDFATRAATLGTALNPATANIEELIKALGGSTTAAGTYIAKLDELGRSQEALSIATAELENLVGVQGVEALKTFGEDSTKLQSVFVQAMTQMQASVAQLINSTGLLKAITGGIESNVLLRQGLQSKDPRQQELVRQREAAGGAAFFGADPAKYFAAEKQLIENQRLINAEKQKQYETQTKVLTAEEKHQEILKETKKLAGEIKTVYQELTNETRKRIEVEQASLERGQAVAEARYNAEKATLDLSNQQLERAYEYAKTQQDRYNLSIALFDNAVQTAKIEYVQQLESIAAAERKLQVELQELKLAQDRVTLKAKELELDALKEKDEQKRLALLEQIGTTTSSYLDTSGQVINEVEKQLASQQLIGQYQRQTAEAQLQSKVLAAQTALEQKLVSQEIGLSSNAARQLAESLAAGVYRASELSGAMFNVAQQTANAAQQMQNAINLQNMLRNGGDQNAGALPAFASGGFVSGPTRALVGEGGAEYIIPAGKMDAAMARYASGQRGDSVIPGGNTAGAPNGDMGSTSINPMINVTTGPVMNMNGSNYVSQRDFVAGMQAASRRGAEMALSAMRKNGGIRRSVGAR